MTTTDNDRLFDLFVQSLTGYTTEQPNDHAGVWTLACSFTAALESAHPGTTNPKGCDGCDRTYDADLIDQADLYPTFQTAHDSNGDPDVTICGACIVEHRDHLDNDPAEIAQREADMHAAALLDMQETGR